MLMRGIADDTRDKPKDHVVNAASRPTRILIGKVGLDGHDRGAKFIVRALRDAGYEVIYTGIRRTPEQIVRTAVDEDVDAIGLSLLSGAHNELFARVAGLLKAEGAESIVLFAGGIIPEQDIPYLNSLGFRRVFTPGSSLSAILSALEQELGGTATGSGASP
jgi:methylmalonyl-CoA mutase C-terminal domain/subunit